MVSIEDFDIKEIEEDDEDNEEDDALIAGICGFIIGILVGMAGMGVTIYFITQDFSLIL